MNFNISNNIKDIVDGIKLFDEINIYPYENTNSPGTGMIDFGSDKPKITIKLNIKHLKHIDHILSHELLHFKLADERQFIFGFDSNQNKTASILLSALEHPLIIERQRKTGIELFKFVEIDMNHNLKILHKSTKNNNLSINETILWADRCSWGIFPSKIKIIKSLIIKSSNENILLFNNIISEINSYKLDPTPQNLVCRLDKIFSLFNPNLVYKIKYLK